MKIVQLTLEDSAQFSEIIEQHDSMMGMKLSKIRQPGFAVTEVVSVAERYVDKFLTPYKKRTYIAFGAYDDSGMLLGFVCMMFSTTVNAWYLLTIMARKLPFEYIGKTKRAMNELYAFCIAFAEQRGYKTYYSLFPIKWFKAYGRFLASSNARKRYNISLDVLIPAKTKPLFSEFWLVMGEMLWDDDLGIFQYTLKPEYRDVTAH